jgi:hypothetical protein
MLYPYIGHFGTLKGWSCLKKSMKSIVATAPNVVASKSPKVIGIRRAHHGSTKIVSINAVITTMALKLRVVVCLSHSNANLAVFS